MNLRLLAVSFSLVLDQALGNKRIGLETTSLVPRKTLITCFILSIVWDSWQSSLLNIFKDIKYEVALTIHDRICYNSLDSFISGTWRYSGFDWWLGPGPQTSGKLNGLVQNNEINLKLIKDWSSIQCLWLERIIWHLPHALELFSANVNK